MFWIKRCLFCGGVGQRLGEAPIIAVTAKAMKNDRDELMAHGFTDYISKPIDDEILIKTIDKHLAVRWIALNHEVHEEHEGLEKDIVSIALKLLTTKYTKNTKKYWISCF